MIYQFYDTARLIYGFSNDSPTRLGHLRLFTLDSVKKWTNGRRHISPRLVAAFSLSARAGTLTFDRTQHRTDRSARIRGLCLCQRENAITSRIYDRYKCTRSEVTSRALIINVR